MGYTAEQYQKLLDIRAKGVRRVQLADRLVEFQTGAELDAAIAQARRDVAAAEMAALGSSRLRRAMVFYRD